MQKISFKKPIKQLSFVVRFFWKRLFLFFILFLFLDILFAAVLFFNYYLKPANVAIATDYLVSFNYTLLDRAVDYWSNGQTIIDQLEQKQYPDLFR